MDTERLKIKTYATAIKSLPDYPSDAGYTAAMLKEAFDSRSDNEIKEKHNSLVDALDAELSEMKTSDSEVEQTAKKYAEDLVSEHNAAEESHGDIRELMAEVRAELTSLDKNTVKGSDINNDVDAKLNAEQLSNPPSTHYARSLIERLETELRVMPSDKVHQEKMVGRANTAFYADEADVASSATKDGDGNRISTTYATKSELETAVGDLSVALDELHAYAGALVNGGEK